MTTPEASVRLPADRAFVLQFETSCGIECERQDDARGRVEHVATGRASRFRSLDELLVFLAAVLRESAARAGEAK